MNLRGEITTDWADGTYTFRLTLAGAIELESKCDSPIALIHARLVSGSYKISDVRETIRPGATAIWPGGVTISIWKVNGVPGVMPGQGPVRKLPWRVMT